MEDYGECTYCGEKFQRPNKFKTEKEALHIYNCELKSLKEMVDVKAYEDEFAEFCIEKDLNELSHKCSLGAKEGNEYYLIMLECNKLLKSMGK